MMFLLHLFTASFTCSIRFPYSEHFYMLGWDMAYTLSVTRDDLARVEPDSEDWLPHVPPARFTSRDVARLCLPKGYDPLHVCTLVVCRPSGIHPGLLPVSHPATRTRVRHGHPSKY